MLAGWWVPVAMVTQRQMGGAFGSLAGRVGGAVLRGEAGLVLPSP